MNETHGNVSHHPDFKELLKRHPGNPILKPEDWPYSVNSIFNPGAIRLHDSGEVLLLVRAEDRRGISHLCSAVSADGISNWKIDTHPTLVPDRTCRPEELWGIEDARISWIPELCRYAITYTSFSSGGPGVSLALTDDFRTFEHYGMLLPPEDKDAALFPRRFGSHWAMIHRPVQASGAAHIWISFSPDLRHWGSHRILLPSRQGAWWDARRIGLAPPPIETPEGWLILYHGVRNTAAGSLYRVGLALLDLENPVNVIYRGSEWIFGPLQPYERVGDVGDVVFPTGFVVGNDGDSLQIYYGAADTSICMATASIKELLEWLKQNSYLGVA
ncbi:MAG: glycosidase [Planctomycetes bacterium]|nr:glycosidase [Planctomycetota bacterium]